MYKAIALQIVAMSDAYSFVGKPVPGAHLNGYRLTERYLFVEEFTVYIKHVSIALCIGDAHLVTVNIKLDVGNSPSVTDDLIGRG